MSLVLRCAPRERALKSSHWNPRNWSFKEFNENIKLLLRRKTPE
jgi:hypothetical protein